MKNKKVLCQNCKYLGIGWMNGTCSHLKNCTYYISPVSGEEIISEYGKVRKCNKNLNCPYWEKGKIKEPSPTPKSPRLGFWKGLWKNL